MIKRLIKHIFIDEECVIAKRKRITCDKLSAILSIDPEAGKTIRGGVGHLLDNHIKWSRANGKYEILIFEVKNLEIHLAAKEKEFYNQDMVEIRYGFRGTAVVLQFEDCRFTIDDIDTTRIHFSPLFYPVDSSSSFRFIENDINCSFSFPDYSEVTFIGNQGTQISIQRHSVLRETYKYGISLEFKKNNIKRLDLDFPFPSDYPISCYFAGSNKIAVLMWSQLIDSRNFDPYGNLSNYGSTVDFDSFKIVFRRSEHIGKTLLKARYLRRGYSSLYYDMRYLFLVLKNIARMKDDTEQMSIIGSYIMLIEYAQIKYDFKYEGWYRCYSEWQNWVLLGWRKISSNYYMSWLRPTIFLVGGYLFFNLAPFLILWLHGLRFDYIGYWEFCLASPTTIPFYTTTLETILGKDRFGELLWLVKEVWFDFLGILRILWMTLWGYALKNVLRAYRIL